MRSSLRTLAKRTYLDGVAREGLGAGRRHARALIRGYGRTNAAVRRRHFAETDDPKLHIGSGWVPREGWLNVELHPVRSDVMNMDAAAPFPFDDGTFAYVFSEHMIEHISYVDGGRMLAECFRVLRPGGRIRISTPDIGFLVDLYGPGKSQLQENYIEYLTSFPDPEAPEPLDTFVINKYVRAWGHQFNYDEPTLRRHFEAAGFVDVSRFAVGESADPVLADMENVDRMPEGYLQLETFTLEAVKPPS
ncbi:MAG: methyltransferase domain-containing protein [Actinomycetota bacterium]